MLNKPYNFGPYNKCNDTEQWVRLSEGCPNQCEFCYEPYEFKIFDVPMIVRNTVKIMDMNLLCKDRVEVDRIIRNLGNRRVNDRVVHYELICGIDHRFMDFDLAVLLHENRFKNIRLAWDFYMSDQYKIRDTIRSLIKAGYSSRDIMIFMICNWKVSFEECCRKLDLCKVWGVKVSDCYYDGQVSPNISPIFWEQNDIRDFRKKCRKHNQLVNFKIDPEIKR